MVLDKVERFLQCCLLFIIDKFLLVLDLRQPGIGTLTLLVLMHMWMIIGNLGPLCFLSQTDTTEMLWMFCLHTWFEIQPCQDTTHQVFCVCFQFTHTPYTKFCGLPLEFSNTVVQLGSILSSDLSDSEDISHKCRDMLSLMVALSESHCARERRNISPLAIYDFYLTV